MAAKIKCVVWDLDNTVWDGILIEDSNVKIKSEVVEVIKTLDSRGILQSISSRNDYETVMEKLKEFSLDEYFLYPQISWNPKSEGIKRIQELLNIGIDTFAFVDDQVFERDEVKYKIPEIVCFDVTDVKTFLKQEIFNPSYITSDSKNRRLLYQNDIKRNNIKEVFEGTEEEFLRLLDMKFIIDRVHEDDLARAEELTVRTHQLNATGCTYSYEELDKCSKDNNYSVLISQLKDKYGDYGKIGLALIEKKETQWILKLLLMSCRVMSRGVGAVMLNFIAKKAKDSNVELLAEFVPTNRNRVMYITYKFAGFYKVDQRENVEILKADFNKLGELPDYIQLMEGEDLNV
ncbi:MAG: HAD-IIIC family phosphatase [Bacillota bacterium]|nr:HAD-IIIC family phosphatase [Bacillota bacterium]